MSLAIPQMTQNFLFTTDMPQADISALESYVEMLTTDGKKSMSYFCDVTDSSIPCWKVLRCLKDVPLYSDQLNQIFWQQIPTLLDRRAPVCLAIDDFVVRRYGETAYATGKFFSNAHNGLTWGNLLVNTTLRNCLLECPVAYELHVTTEQIKVWERALQQVEQLVAKLQAVRVRCDRIWVLGDCKFSNKRMNQALTDLEVFYLLGMPKNRSVELFGRKSRLDKYFHSLPEQHLTVAGKLYTYKLSTANLKDWGRQKLLTIIGPKGRWRYYATNKLNITAKTFIQRVRDRWCIEDTHRTFKNYHGGEHFHVWSKKAVLGHLQLAYLSCGLACLERSRRRLEGVPCTIEQLHRETVRWSRSRR